MNFSEQVLSVSRNLAEKDLIGHQKSDEDVQYFNPNIRQGLSLDLEKIKDQLLKNICSEELIPGVGNYLGISPPMVKNKQILMAIDQVLRKNLDSIKPVFRNLIYRYIDKNFLVENTQPIIISFREAYDQGLINPDSIEKITPKNLLFIFYPTIFQINSSEQPQITLRQYLTESPAKDCQIFGFQEYYSGKYFNPHNINCDSSVKSVCSKDQVKTNNKGRKLFLAPRPTPQDFDDIGCDYVPVEIQGQYKFNENNLLGPEVKLSTDLIFISGQVKEFRAGAARPNCPNLNELNYVGDFDLHGYIFELAILANTNNSFQQTENSWITVESNPKLDQIAAEILSRLT